MTTTLSSWFLVSSTRSVVVVGTYICSTSSVVVLGLLFTRFE